ncbi:VC2046/SO_2500 family protein [Aliidiomarina celeris]|uniref:VC2046/SO_2500 family protein n=1 Tax=Aliidiomarina celeris TaxID=2249428 RepID=UPI000DE9A28A|nr:VC2046/SO_2500 family protein [Aliidiomarina celeris]
MSIATNWIQNERDLGVELNSALHTQEPSRFKFLLASLSPYVYDATVPARESESQVDWQPPFAVGVKRPVAAQSEDFRAQPSEWFHQSRALWFLQDCLAPEPLAVANDSKRIPGYVQTNVPHWVSARNSERPQPELHEADLVDMLDQLHQKAV